VRVPGAIAAVILALVASACGGGGETAETGGDRPTVVVTTTTLGDIVENLAGGQVEVVTVMPVGADPHDFQASAQQANAIREADALVVNGADFEDGLLDVIESAEADGVPTHEAITGVDVLDFGEGESEGGGEDEDGGEDEHAGEEEGAHEGGDPHFFQDPTRTVVAVARIGEFLADEVEGIDADALQASVDAYVAELEALDAEIESLLAGIPEARRILVTNHDAFGYFADRYGFEIVGTVIPSGTTADGVDPGGLAELADVIRSEGVPAIFTETISSGDLAEALADEVGGEVEIVELYTDSLADEGDEASSYVGMLRTNAERIAAALG